MRARDRRWLIDKSQIFSEFEKGYWISRGNFYWQSVEHDIFKPFVNICYSDNRKVVTDGWLNLLHYYGVMVWYGDAGCLVGRCRYNACLRTQALGADGNDIICRFFNDVAVPCKVNYSRGKSVIVFTKNGTYKLIDIVGGVLPPSRYHLVPDFG